MNRALGFLHTRDIYASKRFYASIFFSFILHLCIVLFGWWLYTYIISKPKLHKVDLENLLVLKRGHSLDKKAKNPGAPKPSIARDQNLNTPPMPNTPPAQNTLPQPSSTQTQKSQPTPRESNTPLPQEDYNPKDLKFFNPSQSYAQNTPNTSRARSTQSDKGLDTITSRAISELYGNEWGDLGSAEKNFVTSNLREIARITQSYLQYPPTAAYLRQDGENAIEFYLLPNGDIDGLKLISSSGFVLLDKNSTKTIEIAYKDYPRPPSRTLIRFHITYYLRYR